MYLKNSESELICTVNVKHTLDFEDLQEKKEEWKISC